MQESCVTQAVITKADLTAVMKPLTELHVAPVIQGAALLGVIDEAAVTVTLHGTSKTVPSRLIVYDNFPWNADFLLGLRAQRRLRLAVKHYEDGSLLKFW